ncbi:MAG: prepilin-type N-terminal cleavage/methylation domain-containing protein [Candidatus Hinthialibacter antarcticus]|nr:prepilin-type N-terminal cleavage/methylation domain-containing protein [Candidatus Hinthialibacter antarcticus]
MSQSPIAIRPKQKRKAFTLIELLIVVAIIGILAAIAVPNFINAQVRAKVARAQADMKALTTAIESYQIDNNSFPPDGDDLEQFNPSDYNSAARMRLLTTPVSYISSLPTDPFHTQALEFSGVELLFPGNPPHTYSYNTWGAFASDGFQPANNGIPDNYGVTSLGPNQIFNSAAGFPIQYNITNGTISDGDIIIRGGAKTPFS